MIKKMPNVLNILVLQGTIVIYTLSTVASKQASSKEMFSFDFFLFYGLSLFILGVYAILWQQIIKKFELTVAYANRSVAILWSLVWAVLFFGEKITLNNFLGVVVVIAGAIVVNLDEHD